MQAALEEQKPTADGVLLIPTLNSVTLLLCGGSFVTEKPAHTAKQGFSSQGAIVKYVPHIPSAPPCLSLPLS